MIRPHFTRCLGVSSSASWSAFWAPPVAPDRRSGWRAPALDRAGAEATAIIEKAQATAVVLQAQWMATALVRQAGEIPVSRNSFPGCGRHRCISDPLLTCQLPTSSATVRT